MRKFAIISIILFSLLHNILYSGSPDKNFVIDAIIYDWGYRYNSDIEERISINENKKSFDEDNLLYFPKYEGVFSLYTIISDTNHGKKTVIAIFQQLYKESCSSCPATMLLMEWKIDLKTKKYKKMYETIIDSSGSFGELNGKFIHKQLDTNVSVLLYHDTFEDKWWTTTHSYIIVNGKVINYLYESGQDNSKHRVISKNNILEYKTTFTFDTVNKTLNLHKKGSNFNEKYNEKSTYIIHNNSLQKK